MRFEATVQMTDADSAFEVGRIVLDGDRLGWTIQVGIERGNDEIGMHSRSFGHSEVMGLNVIGVMRYGLNQLDMRWLTSPTQESSPAAQAWGRTQEIGGKA